MLPNKLKKLFYQALTLLAISATAYAGQDLLYSSDDPGIDLIIRKSLSGPVTASIYATRSSSNTDLYEASEVFLKIEDSDENWWVHTPQPFDSMDLIEFIGASHLLVTLSTAVASSTAVLNLADKSLKLIGSGIGAVISSDPEEIQIRLSGQRGNSDGVFWYGSVIDLEGRIIEFLSDGENCVLVAELITGQDDLSKLQQPMDHCIGVAR